MIREILSLSSRSAAYLWLLCTFGGILIGIETSKVLTTAVIAVAFAVLSVDERLEDLELAE